jgi:hypothetical protein
VLQEQGFDDRSMFAHLVDLAQQEPIEGISPSAVSHRLNVSLLVAKEQLLLAEQNEYLCRDDSIRGVYYYVNRFPQFMVKELVVARSY